MTLAADAFVEQVELDLGAARDRHRGDRREVGRDALDLVDTRPQRRQDRLQHLGPELGDRDALELTVELRGRRYEPREMQSQIAAVGAVVGGRLHRGLRTANAVLDPAPQAHELAAGTGCDVHELAIDGVAYPPPGLARVHEHERAQHEEQDEHHGRDRQRHVHDVRRQVSQLHGRPPRATARDRSACLCAIRTRAVSPRLRAPVRSQR